MAQPVNAPAVPPVLEQVVLNLPEAQAPAAPQGLAAAQDRIEAAAPQEQQAPEAPAASPGILSQFGACIQSVIDAVKGKFEQLFNWISSFFVAAPAEQPAGEQVPPPAGEQVPPPQVEIPSAAPVNEEANAAPVNAAPVNEVLVDDIDE